MIFLEHSFFEHTKDVDFIYLGEEPNRERYALVKGCILRTLKTVSHTDISTVIAKGIPSIPEHSEVEYVGITENLYGRYLCVKYGGRTYDIHPTDVEYVRKGSD